MRSSPSDSQEWFADDAFWAATYPFMFPDERFQAAPGELDAVLELVGERPRRVLDVACGPGRHALAAARLGMDTVGVDRSAFLLQKARDRAAREGAGVEWVHADMRGYVRDADADLVLNLFSSFGYFDRPADNERVLENACRSVRPGGSLVVDLMGKEVLARVFRESSVEDFPGGMVAQRRRIVGGWSRIVNTWTVVEGDRTQTFSLGHWLYSGRELEQMLLGVGFASVQLYGDLGGAPYGPRATRLVAVARKT